MILDGKRILITGVVDRHSIAYAIAEQAQQQGGEVLLTSFGRARRITERAAKGLPDPPDVLELDVTRPGTSPRCTTRSSGAGAVLTPPCTRSPSPPEAISGD